jgi:hypothetical protein
MLLFYFFIFFTFTCIRECLIFLSPLVIFYALLNIARINAQIIRSTEIDKDRRSIIGG